MAAGISETRRGLIRFGHGSRQHAPDEYYVIEAENPKLRGMAVATEGYVAFLYALART